MPVRVDGAGAAQLVTLSWAHKRNSLGPEDAGEVADALKQAGAEARSAVILAGEGAFCAGGDLRAFAEVSRTLGVEEIERTVYGRVQAMMRAIADCPVPTIAAVDGPAVGLGFDLALACDIRFVGPHGWLQQGWARAGLVAGTGGIGLLRRLNPTLLWRLIATQERVGPKQAETLSLAEAAEPDAISAAKKRAEMLAAVDREVLGHYVRLSRADQWPEPEHFRDSARVQAQLIGSERFRLMADQVLGADGSRA